MSFWSENNVEPKRNYRFLVTFNGATQNFDTGVVWFAKNVTVPSFNVTSVTHDFLDNKYYYPGRVEWQTISLTLVDPVSPDAVQFVNEILEDTGYLVKNSTQATVGNAKTISKVGATGAGLADMEIAIINEDGNALETWKLQNPFIESAKFGDLDYTNDELRTVELTIKYDWATCDIKDRAETFFKVGAVTEPNNGA
tara:strand:+ start:383 stop:973 length:591 start_codon:yes stop_codon:yes gene_type:complete